MYAVKTCMLVDIGDPLVAPRKFKNLLANVVQDHLPTDGRDPRYKTLSEPSLDIILLSIAHASMRQDRPLTCRESRFGSEVFGAVTCHSYGVRGDTGVVLWVIRRRAIVERCGVVGG